MQDQDNHLYEKLRVESLERRQMVERLVTQFAEAGFHWALAVLGDEEAAYDALQDAWLSAYLHLDQLRESKAFPAWFRQIVITACYHKLRRDPESDPLPEDDEPAATQADPTDEIENKERREHIREALKALPERERIVTELFYFADFPQQEIAEVLAVPVTTVKKRLQYARRHLKGLIHPEFVNQLDLYGFDDADAPIAPDDLANLSVGWLPVGSLFGLPMESIQKGEMLCSAKLKW
jgi:RNA polymerase sigma factor (sigma-70 family)